MRLSPRRQAGPLGHRIGVSVRGIIDPGNCLVGLVLLVAGLGKARLRWWRSIVDFMCIRLFTASGRIELRRGGCHERNVEAVDMTEPVRVNLSAGGLTSYGFAVEAAIGDRPMRYLIGRRISGDTAVTCLFVVRPDKLAGTHVRIKEALTVRCCDVHTYIPTMKRPVRLAERYIFDCLPLTDVGYLDLMAWRYPRLGVEPVDIEIDMSWSRWRSAEHRCYLGPATTPGLTVTEAVDAATGVVVARAVARRREIFRRWEILELGEPGMAGLPRRIRVSRRSGGGWMEFHRHDAPVVLPDVEFEAEPGRLRRLLEHNLPAAA
jgi:hypothetical protein